MIDVPALVARLGLHVVRRGQKLIARCPNPDHEDRHPSWFIRDQDGTPGHAHHRCYACGFRGGPRQLVAAVLGCTEDEAKQWLLGNEVNYTPLDVTVELREKHYVDKAIPIPEWVQFAPWEQWPTLAIRYLHPRRIDAPLVKRWGLGFAVKGNLAGRVWLPVVDAYGRRCSWQARSYIGDELRYMTPDRVRVNTLFGAVHWPDVEDREVVVVVEGPFDAIAVDRATRLPVGALIGSQPNAMQMASLASFKTVVVLTDSDKAGDHAAEALTGMARWSNVVRVRLPAPHDPGDAPDELLRAILGPWMTS
jgi:hypothetical protein